MNMIISKKAQKYYDKSPKNIQEKLDEIFKDICKGKGDIEKLKGKKNQYRYKTYHYRVLFTLDITTKTIVIEKIGPRGDVYNE